MKRELNISIKELIISILLVLIIAMSNVKAQSRYELEADSELLKLSEKVMLSNVGVKEETGRNDGPKIAEILKSVDINSPAPYCQAHIYYCFDEARKFILRMCGRIVKIPIPKSAIAQSSFNYAKKKGNRTKYEPQINDLLVWKHSNSWTGHVERVVEVLPKGWVITVGANTNNGKKGSQREGNGIFIRKRNVKHILGRLKVRGLVGFRSVKYE